MKIKIKIHTAEDNIHYQKGMNEIIEEEEKFELRGTSVNGEEMLKQLQNNPVDIVLTDVKMPVMDGIEATRIIVKRWPHTKVIALTMYAESHLIAQMLEAGAKGYLNKNTRIETVVQAIETVYAGGIFHCPSTLERINNIVAGMLPAKEIQFTEQEKKIIDYICQGYSTKEIATNMLLSDNTVEKHRRRIQDKMGVKSAAGIVRVAATFLKN